ncbi:hypothetical protein [Hathewaya massiliensis]|uniref:hypothetical protein n=1 Tax=Hathewaya massiliensis TaxID=1964382 RepID=UPI001158263F|nr:hypothetical protein [Hathewaya massiliensis]
MEDITSKQLKEKRLYNNDIFLMNKTYGSDKFIHNSQEKGEELKDFVDNYPSFYGNWGKSSFIQESLNEITDDKINDLKK